MKALFLGLSVVAVLVVHAGSAAAQCGFNAVARARGMTTSLVRAYHVCSATETGGLEINTQTRGGAPACQPVEPKRLDYRATTYLFDKDKGGCSLRTTARIEKDCSLLKNADGDALGLPAGPCHVTYVKGTCRGILQADELTPINSFDDAGWSLATLSRWTINDATNGDMTLIDFPITFYFEDPDDGKIKLESSSAEALASILVDTSGPALPTCTSIEILRLTVKDPQGLPFAVRGVSTRTKTE